MEAVAETTPFYLCQRCAHCCRWPGDVKVSDAEIDAIAGFLGMDLANFIERFTRLRADRRGLSLVERPDHSCIFLDGKNCVINGVKPQQCRDFPNKWNFPGWRQVCEAVEWEGDHPESCGSRVGSCPVFHRL